VVKSTKPSQSELSRRGREALRGSEGRKEIRLAPVPTGSQRVTSRDLARNRPVPPRSRKGPQPIPAAAAATAAPREIATGLLESSMSRCRAMHIDCDAQGGSRGLHWPRRRHRSSSRPKSSRARTAIAQAILPKHRVGMLPPLEEEEASSTTLAGSASAFIMLQEAARRRAPE
jgi:hypothetical protein